MAVVQKHHHPKLPLEVKLLKKINNLLARSRWKMVFFSNDIWRKIFKIKILTNLQPNKSHFQDLGTFYSRKSNIPLCFRGSTVRIHKGNVTRKLDLNAYYIKSKFGEYAYTKKLYYYPLKKKNRR